MKGTFIAFGILGLLVLSCRSFEDAKPTTRISLVHFYGGSLNYEGVKAEVDADGGFIIVGNIPKNEFLSDMVIIKTDAQGHMLWQEIIPSTTASDLKVVSDGYLIAGDSIDYQPNPERISELVNTRARLIKMLFDRTIALDYIEDELVNVGTPANPVFSHVDYHGNAITIDTIDNNNEIILLGSFKGPESGSLTKSIVHGLDPSDFEVKWTQYQGVDNRDYVNNHSLLLTPSDNLMWVSTSQESTFALTTGWLSIAYGGIGGASTFKNNDGVGENLVGHYHTAMDMSKSGIGYGAVGTYASADNTNANIYFVRVGENGTIEGSAKYYDAIGLALDDRDASETQDFGNAITGTNDLGFIIGASTVSIPGTGYGKQDILLIKVDAFGGLVWSKRFGGTGDDVVSSIRETSDGSLLICGTNTVNNLSSIFVMKTDKNGELID